MVDSKNSHCVLHIGPNYKIRRGGIAEIIKLYSRNIKSFKFFPSAFTKSKILNFLLLPILLFLFVIYLIVFQNIKIVHIHGASNGSFYRKYAFFFIAKLVFKKKVVYHVHGGKYSVFYEKSAKIVKRCVRRLINYSDCILVLSSEWEDYFLNTFNPKRIEILNNIVEEQQPVLNRNYNSRKLIFLYLGKISKDKGVFDLLQTLKDNRNDFIGKIEVLIGGDGNIKLLNQKIREFDLVKIVKYLGWVDGDLKNDVLLESDIMLLPSYYEGLPVSLLEGMSFSMPLIATNVGGIAKILVNEKNGISIQPGNLTQLGAAIAFYIHQEDKIREHGDFSYEMVREYFPSKVIPKLDSIYCNLINF